MQEINFSPDLIWRRDLDLYLPYFMYLQSTTLLNTFVINLSLFGEMFPFIHYKIYCLLLFLLYIPRDFSS